MSLTIDKLCNFPLNVITYPTLALHKCRFDEKQTAEMNDQFDHQFKV